MLGRNRIAVTTFILIALAGGVCGSARARLQTEPSVRPDQIRVLVLNGTHRLGLAGRISAELAKRGFVIQRFGDNGVPNAPDTVRLTQIDFDGAQPNALRAAEQLRRVFGRRTVVTPITKPIEKVAERAGRPLVVIVIGSTFHGLA